MVDLDNRLVSPRGILFDLDGTLVDTAPDLVGALYDLLDEIDRPSPEYSLCRLRVSQGARGLIELALGIGPEAAEFEALRSRFLDLYAGRVSRESRLYPGVTELLMLLAEKQIPWAVATNKPVRFAGPLLADLQLDVPSGVVVTPDQVEKAKPDPAMIEVALDQLGLPPEQCWFVGDAEQDIIAGRAAGVTTAIARWGYIAVDEPIARWGADRQFNDLAALFQAARHW